MNRNRVKTRVIFALCLFLSFGVLSSCEEEGAQYLSDFDVVVTRFEEGFEFAAFKTYVMPDTLVHIPKLGEYTASDSAFDRALINRVEANLSDLGFVRVLEDSVEMESPVLLVTLTMIDRDYYGLYGWGGYPWYGYWGWYQWGYGVFGSDWYPWYPSYWGYYLYSTGTFVVDMMHVQEQGESNQIPVVWNGIFNGIYSYGLSERMLNGVDQMFQQSPYFSQN